MQSRIYRFEIGRAVVNGVFEAQDTASNASVLLYEWTPLPADREGAKRRLSEIKEQVRSETFSTGASLYLSAAGTSEAEEALKILQSHNLFPNVHARTSAEPPPIPIPAVMPPTPLAVPEEPRKPQLTQVVWLAVLAVVAASIIMFAIGTSVGSSTTSETDARKISDASSQSSQELTTAQSQTSDLQGKISTLQSELKNLDGIHFLRMTNKTTSTVHIAVMYKNWSGVWTLAGWQTIAPSETAVVATSPNDLFYYTAYSDVLSWLGSKDSDAYHLTRSNFVYYPDLQAAPTDWETMKLIKVNGGNLDMIQTKS